MAKKKGRQEKGEEEEKKEKEKEDEEKRCWWCVAKRLDGDGELARNIEEDQGGGKELKRETKREKEKERRE